MDTPRIGLKTQLLAYPLLWWVKHHYILTTAIHSWRGQRAAWQARPAHQAAIAGYLTQRWQGQRCRELSVFFCKSIHCVSFVLDRGGLPLKNPMIPLIWNHFLWMHEFARFCGRCHEGTDIASHLPSTDFLGWLRCVTSARWLVNAWTFDQWRHGQNRWGTPKGRRHRRDAWICRPKGSLRLIIL